MMMSLMVCAGSMAGSQQSSRLDRIEWRTPDPSNGLMQLDMPGIRATGHGSCRKGWRGPR
jgi:hypothetical protein